MYILNIDSKYRIGIPKYFRNLLQLEAASNVMFTLDSKDRVVLFPEHYFTNNLSEYIEQEFEPNTPTALLRVKKYSVPSKIDKRGRVLIPNTLREKASLEKSVYIRTNSGNNAAWMVISRDGVSV